MSQRIQNLNFSFIIIYLLNKRVISSEFAVGVSITVSHLNDTVRSVTGFPVTYHIQQELMREGQRLLYHSNLAVKQIADMLGFEDEKYFNRLFRKVTGFSPGAFRKRYVTSIHS